MKVVVVCWLILGAVLGMQAGGKQKKSSLSPLSQYLEHYAAKVPEASLRANGSLWTADSSFAEMSRDYRAQRIHDLVIIRIVEQTLAQASADVTSQRKMQANSSIPSVAGQTFASLNPLLSLDSDRQLTGKGQANSQTKLQTSVAGTVAAVLPNGVMVIEAERRVRMNNETQTIVLRGMVRPSDVQSDNSVASTALANLDIELKGKGIVSDATRPSNRLVRALLWLTGF